MKLSAKIISALICSIVYGQEVFQFEYEEGEICTQGCTEPPVKEDDQSFEESFTNLSKWLKDLGGELNKVKINEIEPGNREMIATEDITTGDLIAFIPDEMLLTFLDAHSKSPTSQEFAEDGMYDKIPKKERDMMPMVLYLMEQRKKSDSIWKDYIGALPKDMSNHPIFYDD